MWKKVVNKIEKAAKKATHIRFPSSSSGSRSRTQIVSRRESSGSRSQTQIASRKEPSDEMSTSAGVGRSSGEEEHTATSQPVNQPWSINSFEAQSPEEARRLAILSRKSFGRTRCLDLFLLAGLDLLEQFEEVFKAVGWAKFWNIEEEEGCAALTTEFLMTLRIDTLAQGTIVYFRLFNVEYNMSAQNFSRLLGFSSSCTFNDPEGFISRSFWREICGPTRTRKYSITLIHNPTLRFLARWISAAVFPRSAFRCVANEDLKCLFAMCRKIRYSPVIDMLRHWLDMIDNSIPITCTSFVTRIARKLGVLSTAPLEYIPDDAYILGEDHFVQAHFLRVEAGRYIMTYRGRNFELPLPDRRFNLYRVGSLTIPMEMEPPRASFAGVRTRAQAQAELRRQQEEEEEAEEGDEQEEEDESSSATIPWRTHNVREPWRRGSGEGSSSSSLPPPAEGPSRRGARRTASARFRHVNIDDISSQMGGMDINQQPFNPQQLYDEVRDINTRTIDMQQEIHATHNAVDALQQRVEDMDTSAYQFYASYYYHNPDIQ